MTHTPTIALTVDLEDAHHGLSVGPRSSSLESDVDWILALFETAGVRGTFFVLADVLKEFPFLVKRIAMQGHEIGFHGAEHRFLRDVSPRDFEVGLREYVPRLADLVGARVRGFRAPFFSITPETQWCLPILAEHGFEYDASIYPGRNDRYGWAGAPTGPARHAPSDLALFPVPMLSPSVPVAFSGGAYLRVLPHRVIEWGIHRQARLGEPGMIYFHPWEISAELPWRSDARLRANVTRHLFRPRMRARLERLITSTAPLLGPMADVLEGLGELPGWSGVSCGKRA